MFSNFLLLIKFNDSVTEFLVLTIVGKLLVFILYAPLNGFNFIFERSCQLSII